MDRRLPPLNSLQSFAAAAEAGSFTKAGEALFVSQGAVSRQVKLLEAWFGRALFLRTPGGLELTEPGRRLADAVSTAFALIETTADAIKHSTDRHLLKVNLPPTFATRWLAPRLAGFRKLHPGIDFSFTTDPAHRVRDLNGADAAVVFTDHLWEGCQTHRLRQEQHVLVASPELWMADAPPVLQQCTLLHILDGVKRIPIWDRWCAIHDVTGVDTQSGLAFSTLDQAINAALSGTGVAIVDEAMVQPELRRGTLRRVNPQTTEGLFGYWFVSLATDPQRRAGIQLLEEWIGTQLACGDA